jgi:ATP phosphoribosyltransferase
MRKVCSERGYRCLFEGVDGLDVVFVSSSEIAEQLKANGLKVLDDGILLRSEATLFSSRAAPWTPEVRATLNEIAARIGAL